MREPLDAAVRCRNHHAALRRPSRARRFDPSGPGGTITVMPLGQPKPVTSTRCRSARVAVALEVSARSFCCDRSAPADRRSRSALPRFRIMPRRGVYAAHSPSIPAHRRPRQTPRITARALGLRSLQSRRRCHRANAGSAISAARPRRAIRRRRRSRWPGAARISPLPPMRWQGSGSSSRQRPRRAKTLRRGVTPAARRFLCEEVSRREVSQECPAFGRPGSDLLSHVLRRSTISAEEFNGRVRNGIGFRLLAIATRPAKGRTSSTSERSSRRTGGHHPDC